MFESAELGRQIDKETYRTQVASLRENLLEAQLDLLERSEFPVIVVITGVASAGKGDTVNKLNEWLDPRHIETHAFGDVTEEDTERPRMGRYWRILPPKGKIGILFGGWYSDPMDQRVQGKIGHDALVEACDEIVRLERMLVDEGVLLLKFWLHLSRDMQSARIEKLKGDPKTRWRVTKEDEKQLKLYDEIKRVSAEVLRETSSAGAPWIVVEGFDARYRNLTVGQHLLNALRDRLDHPDRVPRNLNTPPLLTALDQTTLLSRLDLDVKLDDETYEEKLAHFQAKLNRLTLKPGFGKRGVVCVFEGPDAAGKGGAIRRITQAIDARIYRVVPIAAPTEEERAQPYLWRFWRQIPRHGHITIFDRSWYGRVLVERVEGFCSEYDWMRAYGEINDFEAQLVRQGYQVVKFWLQITPEEQLKRFEERQNTPYKRFKITQEDWRNREKWGAYEAAVCDMVDRTSTEQAPWTLIEANDKNHARIKVLKTLCERIEEGL